MTSHIKTTPSSNNSMVSPIQMAAANSPGALWQLSHHLGITQTDPRGVVIDNSLYVYERPGLMEDMIEILSRFEFSFQRNTETRYDVSIDTMTNPTVSHERALVRSSDVGVRRSISHHHRDDFLGMDFI